MNKEYIKELFEKNKKIFMDYELDIDTPEDLARRLYEKHPNIFIPGFSLDKISFISITCSI